MTIKLSDGLCLLAVLAGNAQAHDLWITPVINDEGIRAEIGYGHDFPQRGAELDRAHYFNPPQMTQGQEHVTFQPADHPYVYQHQGKIASGVATISVAMKPTFWSNTATGWLPVNRTGRTDVTRCMLVAKYAKSLVNTGKSDGKTGDQTPLGQPLEIIPVTDPFNASATPLGFKVLVDGKPLAQAKVTLNSARYMTEQRASQSAEEKAKTHPHVAAQFQATTDSTGSVEFADVGAGFWLVHAGNLVPGENPLECESASSAATLTFTRS